MFSELLHGLVAVLFGVCFFLIIVIAGMTRTIIRVRREGRFNAKDRRRLIDTVKYTTRSLCVREAVHLLRDYLSNLETELPELYLKREGDKYEKYRLHLVRDHMKQIRVMFEKEMVWEMPEAEEEYSEQEIPRQAPQTQQT